LDDFFNNNNFDIIEIFNDPEKFIFGNFVDDIFENVGEPIKNDDAVIQDEKVDNVINNLVMRFDGTSDHAMKCETTVPMETIITGMDEFLQVPSTIRVQPRLPEEISFPSTVIEHQNRSPSQYLAEYYSPSQAVSYTFFPNLNSF
jgi:hypothetical protein